MARTMKRIVIAVVVLIAVAVAASAALLSWDGGSPLGDVRNQAVNAALDASGVKGRIDSELRSHAQDVSEATGIPQQILDAGIDALAVQDWKATTLPDGAQEQDSLSFDLQGTEVGVTTYDDPDIVTVDAYGQKITFQVPESAQELTGLLPYLDAAQDADLVGALEGIAGQLNE